MPIFKIYCDESRQNIGQYMLVGGVWIQQEYGWNYVNEFEDFCKSQLGLVCPMGHMKWQKVPSKPEGKYFEAYKKLVDLYFDYNSQNIMFFRTLIADRNLYNFSHPIYHLGDYERGFYNLYCQLILNWIQKNNVYHIRVAKRPIKKLFPADNEKFRLYLLQRKINNKFMQKICKYYYSSIKPPVLSIESRLAKSRRLIQIADILMGAVGFYWNKEHLKDNCKEGKLYLAKYIAQKIDQENLIFETRWDNKKFNIFYFDTNKSHYK